MSHHKTVEFIVFTVSIGFMLFAVALNSIATPPTLNELHISSTNCSEDSCDVTVQLDINHEDEGDNSIAQVSNLTLNVYEMTEYQNQDSPTAIATSTDHPIKANTGDSVDGYEATISGIPHPSGCVVIEASAKHGNDVGTTTWEGSLLYGAGNYHSPLDGNVNITSDVEKAKSDGWFESETKNIEVHACATDMRLEIDGTDAELVHEEELTKRLPSKWAFWQDTDLSNNLIDNLPGSPPQSETSIDWLKSEDSFTKSVQIPKGWSGEIKYKLLVERNGLNDIAGTYSGSVDLTLNEG